MEWDWDSSPTYESERLKIDGTYSPFVLFDMRLPRQLTDEEVELMLDIADFHLEARRPFVCLVRQQRGTGVIVAPHRKRFSEWLDERAEPLKKQSFSVVVVIPEAIFRAVLRVVYRFRSPPLRSVTSSDTAGAVAAVKNELRQIGHPISPGLAALFDDLSPTGEAAST